MKDNQINFNNYFKIFNIFSISFIIISISLLLFKGLNYGVDFKGGTLIELQTKDDQITISNLRQSLLNMNIGDVSVKEFGKYNDFLISQKIQYYPLEQRTIHKLFLSNQLISIFDKFSEQQAITISSKSDFSFGKMVWHSGSPILTLYSIK